MTTTFWRLGLAGTLIDSRSCLTPSPRYSGERVGERGSRDARRISARRCWPPAPPLSPALSPAYRGEGVSGSTAAPPPRPSSTEAAFVSPAPAPGVRRTVGTLTPTSG